MRFAVLVFPGTWSDWDCVHALQDLGQAAERVWHRETALDDYDGVILPGGFSYGDHLRCGAIARFSPVMSALERFAAGGKPVFGSCNGFQILCEAGSTAGRPATQRVDAVSLPTATTERRTQRQWLHQRL